MLYVTYDGVLEPLGESQVVAYLEGLTPLADITLLSYEKPADLEDDGRVAAMRGRLERAGIAWIARRYHKWPPVLSTAFDILAGCRTARRWATGTRGRAEGTGQRARRPAIVHARGYVPALIALHMKRARGARFLFDMRGFWVDEKVEAGHWPAGGVLYRVGKWCERRFFANADAIVSLTAAGVREFPTLGRVRQGVPVVVIPTCADMDRFSPGPPNESLRTTLGLGGAVVAGCVGTLSNWYLRQETLAYLASLSARIDTLKVLIVTREDHDRLRKDAVRAGLPANKLVLTRAPFAEMPAMIRLMDVGVFFIRVCFSKRASAATKLAEFLGCGVPVVINDGIGDSGDSVRRHGVGVVLDEAVAARFDNATDALRRLLADAGTRARCREAAMQEFNLANGIASYGAVYEQLS